MSDDTRALQAENARFRAALLAIMKDAPTEEPDYDDWGGDSERAEIWGGNQEHWRCAQIARRALRGDQNPMLGPIPQERAEALQRAAGDLLDNLHRFLRPETHALLTKGVSDAMVHLRVPPVQCPHVDADECATARERSVAGISDMIPTCPVHGP